jgi:hypothetical protein
MKNKCHLVCGLALVSATTLFSVASVQAQVIASDNFDSYSLSSLSSQTGAGTGLAGNWSAAANSGSANVVAPGLGGGNGLQMSVPSSSSSIMAARQLAAPITGQNIYVSYLWQYAAGPGFGGTSGDSTTFALALSDTATDTGVLNYGMRATTGTQTFMTRQGTGGPVAGASLNLAGSVANPSSTYLLVAEYVWDGTKYSGINAWINPTSLTQTTADVTLATGGTLTSLSYVYFREGAPAINAVFNTDNLKIGNTWADVVPAPEPGSIALLTLGAVTGLGFYRRGKRQV